MRMRLKEHAPYKRYVPGTEMAVAQNNLKLIMAPQSPVLLSHFNTMCFVTNHFNSTDINDSYSRICGGEKLKN